MVRHAEVHQVNRDWQTSTATDRVTIHKMPEVDTIVSVDRPADPRLNDHRSQAGPSPTVGCEARALRPRPAVARPRCPDRTLPLTSWRQGLSAPTIHIAK